jgi:hypothetical protein
MADRIRTPQGDWYVRTDARNWQRAIARMKAAVEKRNARMRAWEASQPPGARLEPGYWERYRVEKRKTPVHYPMPAGHVMFEG